MLFVIEVTGCGSIAMVVATGSELSSREGEGEDKGLYMESRKYVVYVKRGRCLFFLSFCLCVVFFCGLTM